MDTREPVPETPDELRHHGGNINAARRLFPNAPPPWIDLSTGINARPYPVGAISPSAWANLPAPSEVTALEAAARVAYGAASGAEIVAAPGTQALIQWLPRLVPARRVGILGFTYAEHETCWRASGAEIFRLEALSELATVDVGIVVNPNNPDGRVFQPDWLAAAAAAMAARGGLLVVDEAFMDVLGSQDSLAPILPDEGALILRSFGKTYGLAGLRLGFALASPPLAAKLRGALGPWSVSGPAIEIAGRALLDRSWLTLTIERLREGASGMDSLLRAASFDILGGTPLFRLARHAEAARLFRGLAEAAILTRPFSRQPQWLRIGIPGTQEAWERLEHALAVTEKSRNLNR